MREDMEYISGVLDELEAIVHDASGVPMRKGRAVVDRADLLVMLDELRGSLPAELAEAESVRRECGAMVAAAEEEAGRIVSNAHARAGEMAEGTELFRRSIRRGNEVVERAQHYAEEVAQGSEVYQDRVMGQLENWFQDSIVSVAESRQELGGVPVRRPPARAAVESARDTDSDGRRWEASSA